MKTDLRIIKTKEGLRTALLKMLEEKPLEQISISELCREAKINRGTFYLHYANVDALFEEYFREITRDLDIAYMEPYRFVKELNLARLNPKTIRIFNHIDKFKSFYRIVFSRNVPMQYYYMLFETMKALFLRNSSNEEVEGHKIDRQLYAGYYANAIIGLMVQWYMDDFKLSVEEMNTQLVRIISLSKN